MIYSTTEQDSSPALTEYTPKPTWKDTLEAGILNFTSVSLTTSASNYYYEERDKTVNEWIAKDPANENVYKTIGTMQKTSLDKLEAMYEAGRYDAIKKYNGVRSRRTHVVEGQATRGTAFLKYKELQKLNGFEDPSDMRKRAEQKAYEDYTKSGKILEDSEYMSAKLLGTAYGALHDPVTLMTLPLGSWKTGATVLGTAARAFTEEALIETAAQSLIVPTTYAYKKQIGVNTTIKDEAYNAVIAIGTAGLLRGTASAAFDLSAKGLKSLKTKDPELAADYETLTKSDVSTSVDSHLDDLHKAEFDVNIDKVSNPNEKGKALNEADPIPFENDDMINLARDTKLETELGEPRLFAGEDVEGTPIYKSKTELTEELDLEEAWINKALECGL